MDLTRTTIQVETETKRVSTTDEYIVWTEVFVVTADHVRHSSIIRGDAWWERLPCQSRNTRTVPSYPIFRKDCWRIQHQYRWWSDVMIKKLSIFYMKKVYSRVNSFKWWSFLALRLLHPSRCFVLGILTAELFAEIRKDFSSVVKNNFKIEQSKLANITSEVTNFYFGDKKLEDIRKEDLVDVCKLHCNWWGNCPTRDSMILLEL